MTNTTIFKRHETILSREFALLHSYWKRNQLTAIGRRAHMRNTQQPINTSGTGSVCMQTSLSMGIGGSQLYLFIKRNQKPNDYSIYSSYKHVAGGPTTVQRNKNVQIWFTSAFGKQSNAFVGVWPRHTKIIFMTLVHGYWTWTTVLSQFAVLTMTLGIQYESLDRPQNARNSILLHACRPYFSVAYDMIYSIWRSSDVCAYNVPLKPCCEYLRRGTCSCL